MNCHEANTWLLGSVSATALSSPLRRHLKECRRCRRQRRRLIRLEALLQLSEVPVPEAAVRERILAGCAPRLKHSDKSPSRRGPWAGFLALAAAAALLAPLALPFWTTPEPTTTAVAETPLTPVPGSNQLLVARFLERDQRLARTVLPGEQLGLLNDMATDLGSETIYLAKNGALEELPFVAGLFERVVRLGVVNRALTLPADQKPLRGPTARRLQETGREMERIVAEVDASAADVLRPMGALAQAAADSIRTGRRLEESDDLPPLPSSPAPWGSLLTVLVHHGLQLAQEEDPVRRADYSNDLNQLEQLLQRASRVVDTLGSNTVLAAPKQPPFTPEQQERVRELERTLRELEKALKKIEKGELPEKHPPPKNKPKPPPREK